jgi:hypothetical protein
MPYQTCRDCWHTCYVGVGPKRCPKCGHRDIYISTEYGTPIIDEVPLPPAPKSEVPARIVKRKGTHVPAIVADGLRKCVSDNGDRDRLSELIEDCKAYDNGRSTLAKFHQLCAPRWHALKKDLEAAINTWQPPPTGYDAYLERDRRINAEVAAGQRSFWKRLFSPGSAPLNGSPAKSVDKAKHWDNFFEFAQIHESLRLPYKSFVGSWPSGVDPALFRGDAGKKLIARLHAFVSGPYPMKSFKDSSPECRVINGKIARGSNRVLDLVIYTVIPRNLISNEEPSIAVTNLIQEYSKLPLPRLLFTLFHLQMNSMIEEGKQVVFFIKDSESEIYRNLNQGQIMLIQVYKGVENTIFGAYDDLPEGGYLSDQAIDKKIRSLLPSS